MSDTKRAIADAVTRLGLAKGTWRELEPAEARSVVDRLLDRFVTDRTRTWWWEALASPATTRHFADGRAFERLCTLVPDPHETIWFAVEADASPAFALYETSTTVAQKLIGECHCFEYYIASQKLTWMLCENHHDQLIAVGDPVRSRLAME